MSAKLIVDIEVIRENFRKLLEQSGLKLLFVCKGSVYGLGWDLIQHLDEFVDQYAVATLQEFHFLKALVNKKILVLMPATVEEMSALGVADMEQLIATISSLKQLELYRANNIKLVNAAFKCNSGLNRFGFDDGEELLQAKEILQRELNSKLATVFTHPAASEDRDHGSAQFSRQTAIFTEFLDCLEPQLRSKMDIHFSDTASFICGDIFESATHLRLGLAALGLNPVSDLADASPYAFPLRLTATPLDLHDVLPGEYVGYAYIAQSEMRTVTLGIGYCDGVRKQWKKKKMGPGIFGGYEIIDVAMNSTILKVPNDQIDPIDILRTEIPIFSNQNELNILADEAQTSIEDILSGFGSGSVTIRSDLK